MWLNRAALIAALDSTPDELKNVPVDARENEGVIPLVEVSDKVDANRRSRAADIPGADGPAWVRGRLMASSNAA